MATALWYGSALMKALNKEIDWDSDTIKVALVTSSYTPSQDVDDYWDDVVANEVANGNGYTTGGITLTNKTIGYTGGTNTIKLDADDVTWAAASITARYAVIYDSAPATDATRPLLGYVNFSTDQTSSSGDFKLTWDANGIFEIVIS